MTTESTGAVGIRILLRRASPGLRLVRGGHVIDLQIGLEQAGLLQDGVDGVFGEKTELAVQDWQRRRGAEPSGLVDERGRRRPAAGRPGRPRRGGRRRGRRSPGGRVAGGQAKAKLAAGREAFRKELESFRGEVHFGVGRIYDTARLLAPRDFFVELLGSLLTGILVSIRAPYRHDLLRALNRVRSRG